MTEGCPGIIRSDIDGSPYCPKDANLAPPEWQTWEDYCAACRETQERWLELSGDARRDGDS